MLLTYVGSFLFHTAFVRLTYQTLTVFLDVVLSKRYTNQSSDIIAVIAGLDQIDPILIAFASAADGTIRNGRTGKSTSCRFTIHPKLNVD